MVETLEEADYVGLHALNVTRLKAMQAKESEERGDARNAQSLIKIGSNMRILALTSPTPQPRVRRACNPVAQKAAYITALTSAPHHGVSRA